MTRKRYDQLTRAGRARVTTGALLRAAATVVLMRPDRRVFLIRRLRAMAFGGMWAFPGGALEAGETPVDEAVRDRFFGAVGFLDAAVQGGRKADHGFGIGDYGHVARLDQRIR